MVPVKREEMTSLIRLFPKEMRACIYQLSEKEE